MTSPKLEVPIRDRKQAAIDLAVSALMSIEGDYKSQPAKEMGRIAKVTLDRMHTLLCDENDQ